MAEWTLPKRLNLHPGTPAANLIAGIGDLDMEPHLHELQLGRVKRKIYSVRGELPKLELHLLTDYLAGSTPKKTPSGEFDPGLLGFEFTYSGPVDGDLKGRNFIVQGVTEPEARDLLRIWAHQVTDDFCSLYYPDHEHPGEMKLIDDYQPWRKPPPDDTAKRTAEMERQLWSK